MTSRDKAAQTALEGSAETIRKYLKENDTEGFGCACMPNHLCGPCSEYQRQLPLMARLQVLEEANRKRIDS